MKDWINFEDRLPNIDQSVDLWIEVGDCESRKPSCFMDKNGEFWSWGEDCKNKVVIKSIYVKAWMPTPKRPKFID